MNRFSLRYLRFLERRASWIIALSGLLVAASIDLIAFHLPLHSDFADLLPADAPSVRAVQSLESRLSAKDTMLMLLVAPDAASREAAARVAIAGVQGIGGGLVERVESSDDATRAFLREHRHLYVPLADLLALRDALAKKIKEATARANPLLVDLDEEKPAAGSVSSSAADTARGDAKTLPSGPKSVPREPAAPSDPKNASSAIDESALASLREKQRATEEKLARSAYVSADGKTQVIVIKTAFRATDVARDHLLQESLDAIAARVRGEHAGVSIGFTGGVTAAVAEHTALLHGMVWSSLFVAVFVALILYLHLRRVRVLVLLSANILAATLVSFGIAALTVGHLNAATAFLGAIIAGNGINYGILLLARFLEERGRQSGPHQRTQSRPGSGDSRSADPVESLARALEGTLRPTLIASLGAAIAYGALAVTHFRGFADFAAIGSIGMLVCWGFSFLLLPALLLKFPPPADAKVSPLFGKLVLRLFAFRKPAAVCTIAALASIAAALVCWSYFARDPFEYDMTQLRSRSDDAVLARRWMRVSDEAFGRGLAGVAGQTYLAAERTEQIPAIVEALHGLQARDPIVGQVSSILDAVPPDQEKKLVVLAELRSMIDRASRSISPRENGLRDELARLRPADELHPISVSELPPELLARIREKDGRVGALVAVRPGKSFDEWNGRDLIHFANVLRALPINGAAPGSISVAGTSLLFADVLTTIQRDGPRVTAVAALGLVILVLGAAGFSRRGLAVLASTGAGSLFMIAACALAGLKINFLDFVALPITLGLGVDYAINVAERASHGAPRAALRSTGGTVFVCSLTTVVGYASLLVSDNLAIRGFGTASLVGELTCVTAALVLVPAILGLRGQRALAGSAAKREVSSQA